MRLHSWGTAIWTSQLDESEAIGHPSIPLYIYSTARIKRSAVSLLRVANKQSGSFHKRKQIWNTCQFSRPRSSKAMTVNKKGRGALKQDSVNVIYQCSWLAVGLLSLCNALLLWLPCPFYKSISSDHLIFPTFPGLIFSEHFIFNWF